MSATACNALPDNEGREILKNFLVAAALGDLDLLRQSLDSGLVSVNDTYNGKPNALSYACMRGHMPLIRYLISQGADVNHQDSMGGTPLHYAAISRCPYSVSALLECGAAPCVLDNLGRTPLSISGNEGGCSRCYECIKHHVSIQPMSSGTRH